MRNKYSNEKEVQKVSHRKMLQFGNETRLDNDRNGTRGKKTQNRGKSKEKNIR